jgi:hypothetical protein
MILIYNWIILDNLDDINKDNIWHYTWDLEFNSYNAFHKKHTKR